MSFSPKKFLPGVSVSAATPANSRHCASLCACLPDLNIEQTGLLVLLQVDVDGEMGVDVSHFVLKTLGDADDHVADEGPDGAEGGDVLARAVVHLDGDGVLGRVGEADGDVA